jgi:BAI1-associated protein 3
MDTIVFLLFFQGPAWQWSGDLPAEAQAVLHQHAIQGDVTAIQSALVKWLAYSRKLTERCLHFAILEALLIGLEENRSSADPLSKDEVC